MTKKVTRRNFFKLIGGFSLAGSAAALSGCANEPVGGKGWIPGQYRTAANWPVQVRGRVPLDLNNPSIVRDDRKCILCGQCLQVCRDVQTVYGYYELPLKNDITCIHCGLCAMWCPTGAITERDDIAKVEAALADGGIHVVVQTAPATKVSLGEEFGLPAGSIVDGKQVAALKKLGFDAVFDTCFSADLTIMEEASELLVRLNQARKIPLFTSCCPGWVKFCEYYYPGYTEHLSTAKSPQQMLGAMAKTYYARRKGLSPDKIVSVAVMPCTAKKYECQRPEMNSAGTIMGTPELKDVDIVLTTRELARLIKKNRLDLNHLPEQGYDRLLGESTGAGVIFGATGGVTEAALRTAYYLATKRQPPENLLEWSPVRGLKGIKQAEAVVPGLGAVQVAVCHGLNNARSVMEQVRQGDAPWQFIEFMACPGGCIGGGGQPRTALPPTDDIRKARIAALHKFDSSKSTKRSSYENKEIQEIYDKYLEHPLSHKAEQLLHTSFTDRSHLLTPARKA
jgi:iron-only hydrogenase group A